MVTVAEAMAASNKELGSVGHIGGEYEDVERIPTGIFELDLAMGGGFPRGMVSIVYGDESSTKTVTCMLAIANHQKLWPDKLCAFIGLEGIDKPWFKKLGVDIEKVAWFQPSFAEQVVDIVESLCYAEDIGLIVLDSIAAMMTTAEHEKSASQATMGGAGIPISKMVRKTTVALNTAKGTPTIIYINQVRVKIGVMYGNPITMPGGNGIKFQSAMTVKLYGKNVMDNAISKVMPVRKDVSAIIQKWKVPIVAVKASYEVVMIPHKGLTVGMSDYFSTFLSYGKSLGLIAKSDKAKVWGTAFGEEFAKQSDLKDMLYSDHSFSTALCSDMIAALAGNNELIEAEASDEV
jgi:recombination protein RecA